MVSQGDFFKAFQLPFSEFVQSDIVQTYLQSLTYHQDQGYWGTIYRDELQFHNKRFHVDGLGPYFYPRFITKTDLAGIVTPRFFSVQGECNSLYEYRLILEITPAETFSIQPLLLLQKNDVYLEAKYYIFAPISTMAFHSSFPLYEDPISQCQSCFLNLDDFLRWQYPESYQPPDLPLEDSDLGLPEEIVYGIFPEICLRLPLGSEWLTPRVLEWAQKNLLRRISYALNPQNNVSKERILTLAREVSYFLLRFKRSGDVEAFTNEFHQGGSDLGELLLELFIEQKERYISTLKKTLDRSRFNHEVYSNIGKVLKIMSPQRLPIVINT